MLQFIRWIFLRLRSFSPIQNDQNTYKNSQTKNFSENAQNVKIYHWNFFGVTIIFIHTKWQKHLQKFSVKKFSKNGQNVEIYLGNFFQVTIIFTQTKWQKHLKICQKIFFSIFPKEIRTSEIRSSRYIVGIFLGWRSFSPIQYGKNT